MAPRLLSDKTLSSLSIFPNAYIRKKFLFGIQTEGLHRQQTGHSPSIPSRNRNPEEERIRIRLDTSIDPSFFIVMVRDVSSSRAYRSIYSALFPPPILYPFYTRWQTVPSNLQVSTLFFQRWFMGKVRHLRYTNDFFLALHRWKVFESYAIKIVSGRVVTRLYAIYDKRRSKEDFRFMNSHRLSHNKY